MKKTTRTLFRVLVLAMAITVVAVSWTPQATLAQPAAIPAYVQIHLNSVIKTTAEEGGAVRLETMELNTIAALLDQQNHRVASAAAYALGEIRDPEAVPALISALNSDRPHMRRIAAHALGKIGDKRAVLPLIDVLSTQNQPLAVQAAAISSLGRIGDPGAKDILSRLNNSSHSWLRKSADLALLKIDLESDLKLASAK